MSRHLWCRLCGAGHVSANPKTKHCPACAKIVRGRTRVEQQRQRLLALVDGATRDRCIEWAGCKTRQGYGSVKFANRSMKAHRVIYMLKFGELPNSLYVLHNCDNPSCINPHHLKLGTHNDNMADMVAKGRGRAPEGSVHPFAKLTEASVLHIRSSPMQGRTLARLFSVSETTISEIRRNQTWKHVA